VKKLIHQDKVDIIIGGWLSGVGLAEAPHIFAAKKLWLSAGPASPKFSKMVKDNYEKAKYWFRIGPISSKYQPSNWAEALSELFKKKLGLNKVAILAESSVWAREVFKGLKKAFPEKGLDIVYSDVFDPKRTDFSPQFARIRDSKAQIMTTIQAVAPGIPLTLQWANTELPVNRAGYDMNAQNFNYWDKTGGKCYGMVCLMANGARAEISPLTIPFFDKYVEKYDKAPTYTSFAAYDALYLLKDAAEKANSLDTEKLIKTLEKTSFNGTAGWIKFDQNHDLIYDSTGENGKGLVWVQWQGPRKMVVLYPFKFAMGDYVYPKWMKKK